MLPACAEDRVRFPATSRPRLVVIVDAEEEFDWAAPFSRANRNVKTVAAQVIAHRIFDRYGIVPSYAVDYPVASQEDGYLPLRELMQSGRCEIGAQLHPWVTPPHEEEVSEKNSFAGNLPPDLERRKIALLTEMIERNFGRRPKLYRAGRYGAGPGTARALAEFGYEVDCSVLPGQPAAALGPDYTGTTAHPYWLGQAPSVLELPVTVATLGVAGEFGDVIYGRLASPVGRMLKIPAVMARLSVMERIRLTPEGTTLDEAKRLTRTMFKGGHRVFTVSYHSPSLVPGHTQYVRNRKELDTFLFWLEGYFAFFFGELNGESGTPGTIREWALSLRSSVSVDKVSERMCLKPEAHVSVVIPAHNSAPTIERALNSVFAQSFAPSEIVVVDDCSTDETATIVERYGDQGVRLVRLAERSGAAGARNAGIRAATSEYIAFLDSDDEWRPEKLEKQVQLIADDPSLSLVSCASNLISSTGKDLGDIYNGHIPTVGSDAWKALLVSNFIATPTVIARREQLLSLGCFDCSLKIGEDQDMWIRLALAGGVGYVHESLVRVHERENSLSNWVLEDQLYYTLPMIDRHIRSLSHRLTHGEIRKIRGERIGRLGRAAYAKGRRVMGAKMVIQSVLLGHRSVDGLYYLAIASPPATWLKRLVRGPA
jgi:glycosyltransferase involved in cell wall biosynthesis